MRLERVRPWDWVAGAAGVALLVVLALPWYDLLDGSLSGFQAFSIVDLWLGLTALLAIAIPIATAFSESPPIPLVFLVSAEACSWIAFLLALWRAVDDPGKGLDPTAMPWIAVLVVLALSAAVWRAMRDERAPGVKQPPPVRTMPAPPPTAPSEPT